MRAAETEMCERADGAVHNEARIVDQHLEIGDCLCRLVQCQVRFAAEVNGCHVRPYPVQGNHPFGRRQRVEILHRFLPIPATGRQQTTDCRKIGELKQILEMEKSRQSAYGSLDQQLKTLAGTSIQLQKETGSLVTALRAPQVRGRWGEMTLRRTAELAGMSAHCDFVEQETMTTDEGRQQRPDMIVNLPGGRRIVIDAKVTLQAFLDAASATNEDERHTQLARHAQLVRSHMNQLASRAYSEQFDFSPEVVVLFLPGESFFAAALEEDRALIDDAMQRRVILSTPTTLIALLKRALSTAMVRPRKAASQTISSLFGKSRSLMTSTSMSAAGALSGTLPWRSPALCRWMASVRASRHTGEKRDRSDQHHGGSVQPTTRR